MVRISYPSLMYFQSIKNLTLHFLSPLCFLLVFKYIFFFQYIFQLLASDPELQFVAGFQMATSLTVGRKYSHNAFHLHPLKSLKSALRAFEHLEAQTEKEI